VGRRPADPACAWCSGVALGGGVGRRALVAVENAPAGHRAAATGVGMQDGRAAGSCWLGGLVAFSALHDAQFFRVGLGWRVPFLFERGV